MVLMQVRHIPAFLVPARSHVEEHEQREQDHSQGRH